MLDDQELRDRPAAATPVAAAGPLALAHEAARLLNEGDSVSAATLCEALLDADDLSLEALDMGLWVVQTVGADALTLRMHQRAAAMAPLDATRQHTAAAVLLRLGLPHEAIPFAAAACELRPEDPEAAFLLGAIRNAAGLHTEAIRTLLRAVRLKPNFAEAFHHLAFASMSLGHPKAAARLALEAVDFDRSNPWRAIYAAHLLRLTGRLDEAIAVLARPPAVGEAGAVLCRNLSDCLVEAGRLPEALAKVDEALALSPDHPEYLLHRAALLNRDGRFDEAAHGVDAALRSDPDNLHARRHAVSLYVEGGNFDRAIASTAELLRRVPDNDEYASCMLHVLSLRGETPAKLPDLLTLKRNRAPRPPRPPPTLASDLRTQGRVTVALLLREMRTRFGESRLGYLWVIMEMVIHLGVLAIVFQFMMHGEPPMGHSFFFFYFTGLTPYLLFLHTSEHAGQAIVQNRHMLQLPMVTNFNVILARGILELFTSLVITGLFSIGFLAASIDALPSDFGQALCALLTAWLLGLGFGMISAVLNTFFHFWHHVVSILIRVLYFCSGIFYVPGIMPVYARDVLVWNPLLHCVDWFRTNFFESYEPHWLDRGYAVLSALCLLLLGLLLEAAFRRRLRLPA